MKKRWYVVILELHPKTGSGESLTMSQRQAWESCHQFDDFMLPLLIRISEYPLDSPSMAAILLPQKVTFHSHSLLCRGQ